MCIVNDLAQMIGARTRFVAETALEDVPFPPVHRTHEQRDPLTNWMHETREGVVPLAHGEVEVIGHDRERDKPRIRSTQPVAHDASHCIAQFIVSPPVLVTAGTCG